MEIENKLEDIDKAIVTSCIRDDKRGPLLLEPRAAHRNRTNTGLRPFFTGTRTVPLVVFFFCCTPRHHTVRVG